MKWLPYHRFEFHSPMSREAAIDTMSGRVEAIDLIRFFLPFGRQTGGDLFEGEILDNVFNVRRVTEYARTSTVPQVRIVVDQAANGSLVRVTMVPHVLALVFPAIVFAILSNLIVTPADRKLWLFAGFVVIICIWGWIQFWSEVNQQEQALRLIFRARD